MSPSDARETYEMLRAAHTLLRMSFGACALIYRPSDKDAAKRFSNKFDNVFKIIQNSAEDFLKLSLEKSSVSAGADDLRT